jgi:pimeloyl-ACP methyl ester carboxylesterase
VLQPFGLKTAITRRRLVKGLGMASAIGGLALTVPSTLALAENTVRDGDDASSSRKPSGFNVVLLHGAYAAASSWSDVIGLLQKEGHNVLAVELPLTSLADDIAVTRQALASAAFAGPTVVAGHSYAGSVMTEACSGAKNVIGLVYATAFAPLKGESIVDLAGLFPAPPANQYIVPSYRDGFIWLNPAHFPQVFCQDIKLSEARILAVSQKPIVPDCFATKVQAVAWQEIPSWFLVSKNDRSINPDLERFMAKRSGATTIEVDSSHASPVSHPRQVAGLIEAAIKHYKKA